MLFRRKRDLTAEFRRIFEEGAEIENPIFFEPVLKIMLQKLQEAGVPPSQMRRALKAGLKAAQQKHVDMNLAAFGFDDLDLNGRPHLLRALPFRKGVTTVAFLSLLLMNAAVIGGIIYAAIKTFQMTASWLWAVGVGLVAVVALSYAIKLYSAMAISVAFRFQRPETPEEIAAKRREEDMRTHVRRESPPPIATAPSTFHKMGLRRFRLGVLKALVRYSVLAAVTYLVVRDSSLAMLVAAVPVIIFVTYAQLQPLRTTFDALIFGMLHPPRSALGK